MSITPAILARTKQFEGVIAWMYLDSLGNVTVGVGHLLASLTAAQAVAFVVRSDAVAAGTDQITTDYTTVQEQPAGLEASAYEASTTLQLAPGEDDALLTADLQASESQLRAALADYDYLPPSAQAALIDMMFNMGPAHFNAEEWPHLFAAVNAGDWNTAAEQSCRPAVSADRNAEIASLFRDAASGPASP